MTGHLPWGHSVRKQPKNVSFSPYYIFITFDFHRQKMDKIAILHSNANFDDYEK